jgi:hypothetical protein
MNQRKSLTLLALCLLIFASAVRSHAQANSDALKACESQTKSFDAWAGCLIDKVATPIVNQRHPAKQVELTSLADNTTSLVDQTSAPDIVGLALNLAGLKSESGASGSGTSGAITTSAYALYAAAKGRDPLDPDFYKKHPDLRRFSFSVGRDAGDEKDPTKTQATLVGFKVLLLNSRDVSVRRNSELLREASDALAKSAPAELTIRSDIQDFLFQELGSSLGLCGGSVPDNALAIQRKAEFLNKCVDGPNLTTTVSSLTPEQRKRIKEIILRHIDNPATFVETVNRDVWKIRRAPQLSFAFDSKLRNGIGDDEYRAGLLFDYGVYERLNLTLNGTFDYKDSKIVGGDTRAGRFAAEGIFQLTPNRGNFGDPRPWLLSSSAEAKWANNNKSTYTGQLKLTIPIPGLTGVNFPISLSVANRSDLIKEKTVRGKFGFTIDITKLLSKAP